MILDFLRKYPSVDKNRLLGCKFAFFFAQCFGIELKKTLPFASKSSLFITKSTFARSLLRKSNSFAFADILIAFFVLIVNVGERHRRGYLGFKA